MRAVWPAGSRRGRNRCEPGTGAAETGAAETGAAGAPLDQRRSAIAAGAACPAKLLGMAGAEASRPAGRAARLRRDMRGGHRRRGLAIRVAPSDGASANASPRPKKAPIDGRGDEPQSAEIQNGAGRALRRTGPARAPRSFSSPDRASAGFTRECALERGRPPSRLPIPGRKSVLPGVLATCNRSRVRRDSSAQQLRRSAGLARGYCSRRAARADFPRCRSLRRCDGNELADQFASCPRSAPSSAKRTCRTICGEMSGLRADAVSPGARGPISTSAAIAAITCGSARTGARISCSTRAPFRASSCRERSPIRSIFATASAMPTG